MAARAQAKNKKILQALETGLDKFRTKMGNLAWEAGLAEVLELGRVFERAQYYSAGGTLTKIAKPHNAAYIKMKKTRWAETRAGWANGVLGRAILRGAILRRESFGWRVDFSRVQRIRRYWAHFAGMKAPGLGHLKKGYKGRVARHVREGMKRDIASLSGVSRKAGNRLVLELGLDDMVSGFRGVATTLAIGRRTRSR